MTEQAFLDAVRRDQAMLYRVAYTLLHNGEDCNDALQDAVVNAWRRLHTLRDDAAFRPWMTRITVNCAKDMLRKRRLETVELPETLAAPAVEDTALSDALARLKEEAAEETGYHAYVQWLFGRQWARLKRYANERGVKLFGDMPIYASEDSADCWAHPELFQLDEKGRPTHVAGVPPDYFSADGQRWGNPLYDWKALKKTRYGWWVERMRQNAERFDIVRLDHFIGFANYYSIPVTSPTARVGEWIKGPGRPLFAEIEKRTPGLSIVAEDLGVVSPRVRRLIRRCGYPGMHVLEFAFGGGDGNPNNPAEYEENSVVYTGTHDNDTLCGFLEHADENTLADVRRHYPGAADLPGALIGSLMESRAYMAIVPMQDWLRLGGDARMNTPGTVGDFNWTWRMDADANLAALAPQIRARLEKTGRLIKEEIR